MKVFVARSIGDIGKFQAVVRAFSSIWHGRILDVGCRSRRLKSLISPDVSYFGLDLLPPADLIANLELGLPFGDGEFDVVVALDVLEHTNNFHASFAELCRVSCKYIVLSLPNAYDIKSRVRFTSGKPISGKYGLPAYYQLDRHRWLFPLEEASQFCHVVGPAHGFVLHTEGALVGSRRPKKLVRCLPNVFAPTYMALLVRSESAQFDS